MADEHRDTGPAGAVISSTRERILLEASYLFSRWGYHNTTTRDIAVAVGIRQPSLCFSSRPLWKTFGLNLDRAVSFATASVTRRAAQPHPLVAR